MQDQYVSEVSGVEQYRIVYAGTSAECNREAKRLNAAPSGVENENVGVSPA